MNADFVSFSLAKKLKEKGFNEECLAYYTSDYTLYTNKVVLCDDKYLEVAEIDYEECLRSYNTEKDRLLRTIVDAPTISQVLKWLREEKKIYLELVIVVDAEYMCDIYKIDARPIECLGSTEYSKTYESAALAGIEYCLDNLI